MLSARRPTNLAWALLRDLEMRPGDTIRVLRCGLGLGALTAAVLFSAAGRAEKLSLAQQLRCVRPPIGVSRGRFEQLVRSFHADPVFAKAKAMVAFGSRLHHDYGWKPESGSDLDLGIHIPAAYLTNTQARTVASPMQRALDTLVNGEPAAGPRGTASTDSRIEVRVAAFKLATALWHSPEFAHYLPLEHERQLFASVSHIAPRRRQQVSYRRRKLEVEEAHAPPSSYPEPSWYDRQAIVVIKPSPDELGRILDALAVEKLAALGYQNVLLPPAQP